VAIVGTTHTTEDDDEEVTLPPEREWAKATSSRLRASADNGTVPVETEGPVRRCEQCHRPLIAAVHNQRFCSERCREDARNAHRRGDAPPRSYRRKAARPPKAPPLATSNAQDSGHSGLTVARLIEVRHELGADQLSAHINGDVVTVARVR
jgi:hypothetical protein